MLILIYEYFLNLHKRYREFSEHSLQYTYLGTYLFFLYLRLTIPKAFAFSSKQILTLNVKN